MKLIIAIVRPFTIEKLVVAFEDIEDFPGMSMTDVAGFGRGERSAPIDTLDPFRRSRKIEIVCDEGMVSAIVDAIKKKAHTGRKGDGFILVLPVEDSVLI
ncbi:MAG TPA: P-II family nitrogen regulator [Pyrinomonadaceae bacterium]|nr:P-II family nitrogen regulator [Pyrinomonadaceae bacterium]